MSPQTTERMNRSGMVSLLIPTLLGFVLLAGLCTVPGVDLYLSGRFYDAAHGRGWFLQASVPWIWLYDYGEYPSIVMAVSAAVILAGSCVRPAWADYRRHCLVLVLVVALGPGLLVNGILKPLWGRPRPRQTVEFGGTQPYRPWWRPGGPGAGKSFPSGHTAIGYALIAGAFLTAKRGLRLLIFTGGLAYGTIMGVGRVIQGAHFASDAVWAGVLMCGVVWGVHRLVISDDWTCDVTDQV